MALTGRRWIQAAFLGCLTLAIAFLPTAVRRTDLDQAMNAGWQSQSGWQSRNWTVSQLGQLYALVLVRDSVVHSVNRLHNDRRPVILRYPAAQRMLTVRLSKALDTLETLIAPTPTDIQTVAVALEKRVFALPQGTSASLPGSWYVMPAATGGHLCLAFPSETALRQLQIAAEDSEHTSKSELGAMLLGTLGPCAFYTAFGAPSPTIERWLRSRGYSTLLTASWPFDEKRSRFWDDLLDWELDIRACASGNLAQCRSMVGSKDESFSRQTRFAIAQDLGWYSNTSGYLSDVVREQGPEKFARFWHSNLAPEAAFEESFGLSMPQSTQLWLLHHFSVQPTFGPRISLSVAVMGLVLATLLVAGTALTATRRQVA